jgi:hypothetical protein
LGITGEDLLREAAPELEGRMHLVKARWASALPMSWWRYRNIGSMFRPWLIWTMSALPMPRRIAVGCGWQPNTRS